ncbi:DNA invertase Pin-like site-specific DNA recombinase [Massilia sp. MP_M2]|uniref:recombinase family protein n=1 Tax=Massilia sp. MP_M2 TaxID=3071713 RepID=UPI00319DC46E
MREQGPNKADLVAGGLLIGYARVSTADQNLDLQRDALQRAGCAEIYEEKKSGRAKTGRPELANAMRALRPGDTLVVWRLDRLGRSLVDLVNIINELTEKKVGFVSLTEQINTGTAQGRMFLGVLASLAQYVRDLMLENTMEGLKAARARGRVGGRKPSLDDQALKEISALLANPEITVASVAKRYNVSRSTLYNSLARAEKPEKKPGASHDGI